MMAHKNISSQLRTHTTCYLKKIFTQNTVSARIPKKTTTTNGNLRVSMKKINKETRTTATATTRTKYVNDLNDGDV